MIGTPACCQIPSDLLSVFLAVTSAVIVHKRRKCVHKSTQSIGSVFVEIGAFWISTLNRRSSPPGVGRVKKCVHKREGLSHKRKKMYTQTIGVLFSRKWACWGMHVARSLLMCFQFFVCNFGFNCTQMKKKWVHKRMTGVSFWSVLGGNLVKWTWTIHICGWKSPALPANT